MNPRKTLLLIASTVSLAAVGWFTLQPATPPHLPATVASGTAAQISPPGVSGAIRAVQQKIATFAPEIEEAKVLSPHDRIRQIAHKTDLQQAVLKDYDQFRRYPPQNTRIISEAQDPISHRYAVDERTTLNEDRSAGLTVWSDQKYYLADDDVSVSAFVVDAEGEKMATEFSATLVFNAQTVTELEMADADGDLVQNVQFNLGEVLQGNVQPGIYKVIIINRENELMDAVAFTLSQPDIQLTGDYRDQIDAQGNLLIEAEVEVRQPSRFYVQASLYSIGMAPIGGSQFSGHLSAGKQWVKLGFPGIMLHDAGEHGPFTLAQVSVAKVTMPLQRGPLQKPGYTTEAYRLDEFSREPFESPLTQSQQKQLR